MYGIYSVQIKHLFRYPRIKVKNAALRYRIGKQTVYITDKPCIICLKIQLRTGADRWKSVEIQSQRCLHMGMYVCVYVCRW